MGDDDLSEFKGGSFSLSQIVEFKNPGQKNYPDRRNVGCQRCLERGHWTYECKKEPKYTSRPSRTSTLEDPRLEEKIRLAVRAGQPSGVVKRRRPSTDTNSSTGSESSSGTSNSGSTSNSTSQSTGFSSSSSRSVSSTCSSRSERSDNDTSSENTGSVSPRRRN